MYYTHRSVAAIDIDCTTVGITDTQYTCCNGVNVELGSSSIPDVVLELEFVEPTLIAVEGSGKSLAIPLPALIFPDKIVCLLAK